MGIAANKFRLMYLTRNKSDIEFQVSILNQRRIALLDQSKQIAIQFSNNIFQTGENSQNYGGQIPGLLPGMTGWYDNVPFEGVTPPSSDPFPTGNLEQQLAVIQAMDKEIEVKVQVLDVQLKAADSEVESVKKILTKNIETDYKTFA